MGAGLIGKTLLKQLVGQEHYLEKYETIKPDSIDSIAFKFAHKKFNFGLFAVNTLNE